MNVTGLTNREFPSTDMFLVQVTGLCIGGSVVVANEQEGYIFDKSGQDKKDSNVTKSMTSCHSSTL